MADRVMKTTVSELPESRARVEVEVSADEVAAALDAAARSLGKSLKLAGFRKGKIPSPVVIQRLGRDAVLDEALRSRIGRWYSQAIDDAQIAPVGDPDISLGELPADGEPMRFAFEIGVRPTATLGAWRGLEVARREPTAREADVERQLEDARERLARLEPVQRAAVRGDFVVIDYAGTIDGALIEGGHARGQLLELGSGRLVPGFEEGLIGAGAGEQRTIAIAFPQDYEPRQLAGRDATFEVTVSEVREKVLPELDDDFATDAAGFETLDEMRAELRAGLLSADERAVEREFRGAVLDAAVAAARVSVPDALIDARAQETWERTLHSLEHRGLSKDAFLQIAGKSEEELLAESRPDAEQSLRREAVLAAIIAEEGIEPSDADLLAALVDGLAPEQRPANAGEEAKLLDRLRKAGRLQELREDVAGEQALELLVSAATPLAPGLAAAREKLWTPGS
ncbi:MAG: trigger factor [Solirubrobacteraceae bacterium]